MIDDGVDQNCDGGDLCYLDADDDGFRPLMPATVASSDLDCSDPFEATAADPASDCDDSNPSRFPTNPEVIDDGVDQDCDGGDLCYADADNDGFRPVMPTTVASSDLDCTDPFEATAADPASDCNDGDSDVHPGAEEVCNDDVDNDCDDTADCGDPECEAEPVCLTPCDSGPFVCKEPGRATLQIRNRSDDRRDTLRFKWTLGDATSVAQLGDPTVDTGYTLCVWDHVGGTPNLVMDMEAPPAGNCTGRPCWKPFAGDGGFRYRDVGRLPDGIVRLDIRSGPLGRPRVFVKAKGVMMPDPPMPFAQAPQITVQVINSLGNCWGVDFVSPASKNSSSDLVAKEAP